MVLCTNAMEFLTDPRCAFREVYRVLKPRGAVHLSFLSKDAYGPPVLREREAGYWANFSDAQKM